MLAGARLRRARRADRRHRPGQRARPAAPARSDAERRQCAARSATTSTWLLDACGYPLCRGGIMAGRARLLSDAGRMATALRPLDRARRAARPAAGQHLLRPARPGGRPADWPTRSLREVLEACAGGTPRFLKQMALNALAHEPPLNWLGGIETDAAGGIDLKLQGTALFVDAARVYALARRVAASRHPRAARGRGAGAGRAAGRIRAPGSAAFRVPADCCGCACSWARPATPAALTGCRWTGLHDDRPAHAQGEHAHGTPAAAAVAPGL